MEQCPDHHFDTTSMADTDKNDVDASGMNKQAALDYSSVDAALATVPEDLSIYTDETANAVTSAVKALSGTYKAATQDDVDKLATAITDAVNALVERGLLTVTNETLMFNVEKAILRDAISSLPFTEQVIIICTKVLMKKLLQMVITETTGSPVKKLTVNGNLLSL